MINSLFGDLVEFLMGPEATDCEGHEPLFMESRSKAWVSVAKHCMTLVSATSEQIAEMGSPKHLLTKFTADMLERAMEAISASTTIMSDPGMAALLPLVCRASNAAFCHLLDRRFERSRTAIRRLLFNDPRLLLEILARGGGFAFVKQYNSYLCDFMEKANAELAELSRVDARDRSGAAIRNAQKSANNLLGAAWLEVLNAFEALRVFLVSMHMVTKNVKATRAVSVKFDTMAVTDTWAGELDDLFRRLVHFKRISRVLTNEFTSYTLSLREWRKTGVKKLKPPLFATMVSSQECVYRLGIKEIVEFSRLPSCSTHTEETLCITLDLTELPSHVVRCPANDDHHGREVLARKTAIRARKTAMNMLRELSVLAGGAINAVN